MEPKRDFLIVGAFGRGADLAVRLQAAGLSTFYVDTTSRLGQWIPTDWSGPIGYFGEPPETQKNFFKFKEQPSGFTVWSRQGPLELRGPLKSHHLESWGLDSESIWYLQSLNENSPAQVMRQKVLVQRPLTKTWLAQLSHQLGSCRFWDPFESTLNDQNTLSLFDAYHVIESSKGVMNDMLQFLRDRGIGAFEATQISDISVEGKRIEGMEIAGPKAGILMARQLIWFLSAEESQRLNSAVVQKIFPKPGAEAEWTWVEFRFEVSEAALEVETLPDHFLMLQDVRLPWTHENFVMVQRRSEKTFSCWMRLPSTSRFQRDGLESLAASLIKEWQRRLPVAKSKIKDLPMEFQHSFEQRGSPKFPIYSQGSRQDVINPEFINLHYAGPTLWKGLGWNTISDLEAKLFDQLKGILDDSKVHPS